MQESRRPVRGKQGRRALAAAQCPSRWQAGSVHKWHNADTPGTTRTGSRGNADRILCQVPAEPPPLYLPRAAQCAGWSNAAPARGQSPCSCRRDTAGSGGPAHRTELAAAAESGHRSLSVGLPPLVVRLLMQLLLLLLLRLRRQAAEVVEVAEAPQVPRECWVPSGQPPGVRTRHSAPTARMPPPASVRGFPTTSSKPRLPSHVSGHLANAQPPRLQATTSKHLKRCDARERDDPRCRRRSRHPSS